MSKRVLTVTLACLLLSIDGGRAVADTLSPDVKAAQDAKAIAEAEKLAAEARLAKAKAERDLANLDALEKAELDKAVADAEKAVADKVKAAADAQAAAIAADQAAVKAKFGSVSANSVTPGNVEAGANAGSTEASLLAAKALADMAKAVAGEIADSNKPTLEYVLFTGKQKPGFGNLHLYEFKRKLLDKYFAEAVGLSTAADEEFAKVPGTAELMGAPVGAPETLGLAITGAGAILDSLAKLGSFFQTSYKFENLTVTGSDDELLAAAVAHHLGGKAYLPGRWTGANGSNAIFTDLEAASASRIKSQEQSATAQQRLTALGERLKTAQGDPEKRALQAAIDAYQKAVAGHQLAQKAFDDFLTSLAAAENDQPAIAKVIDEKFARDKIAGGAASLFVHVHMAGGSSYTRKNLWTFLGTDLPFRVMGGAVVSYVMLDADGKLLKSNSIYRHGGYHAVNGVQQKLNGH